MEFASEKLYSVLKFPGVRAHILCWQLPGSEGMALALTT
jgi:hypothetical protein